MSLNEPVLEVMMIFLTLLKHVRVGLADGDLLGLVVGDLEGDLLGLRDGDLLGDAVGGARL